MPRKVRNEMTDFFLTSCANFGVDVTAPQGGHASQYLFRLVATPLASSLRGFAGVFVFSLAAKVSGLLRAGRACTEPWAYTLVMISALLYVVPRAMRRMKSSLEKSDSRNTSSGFIPS